MEGLNLAQFFAEFKDLKGIDRPTLMSVLEDVFRTQLAKTYGTAENFDIIINIDKGDLQIWRNRTIVEEVEDPMLEISKAEIDAKQPDNDFEIGEEYSEEIPLSSFGRRAVLNLRQNLSGRIMDIDKANLFNYYKDKIGDIVVGEVYQVWKKEVLVRDDADNELVLPKSEQIPSDYFRKGDSVKAVVAKVEMKNNTPSIILSRTASVFLERLFEQEVPEIFDGLITIKKIVRMPGDRAKVAVESYDDRIDPVGACVGVKGSRIHGIVRELRNENIDVISWTTNTQLLIQRALSPAKISTIKINEEEGKALITMDSSQVSLAVGKNGSNIRLAEMMIGMDIEIFRDVQGADDDDVLLSSFNDEIDQWVIDALRKVGFDTAKDVLRMSTEDIMERADLDQETVEDVKKILQAEFEDPMDSSNV
ncbi:MAG: transcription termination/antitermination protein NusA [Bacteroidales bacterium]|nr:transcription termination/antitermination protein NusA [Bacteroidales bacterium]